VVTVQKFYRWLRFKTYWTFLVFGAEGENFPKRHITVNARPSLATQKPLRYDGFAYQEVWTLLRYAVVSTEYVGVLTIFSILAEIRLHQAVTVAIADSGLH
jgi:hypothetical protein